MASPPCAGPRRARARHRHEARDASDVHDAPAAQIGHPRKDGLGHGHEADDVGLDDAADLLDRRLGDGSEDVDACVVDEHVDPTRSRDDRVDGGADRRCVAHVETERLDTVRRQVRDRLRPPRRGEGPVARRLELPHQRAADARRTPRDEDDLLLEGCHDAESSR